MNDQQFEKLIAEILSRLVPRLGADGRNGRLIAVFSGATVGFADAVQQVRNLVLNGFQVQLLFSAAAESLYGSVARTQLAGFPHIADLDSSRWLKQVQDTQAVVVPLLSVNTLSKITLLLADNLTSNVLLQALFMGKPVVMASDGVDPFGAGRQQLGFIQGKPALQQALQERLRTATEYGCRLVPTAQLHTALMQTLGFQQKTDPLPTSVPNPSEQALPSERALRVREKVIPLSRMAQAHRSGMDLMIPTDAIITPLAREWAASHGLRVIRGLQSGTRIR